MKTKRDLYTIGLDFGTLSGRALLVDVGNGQVMGEAVMDYPHGVLDHELPTGEPIPKGWAFQHPGDYLEVLEYIVPTVVRESGVDPEKIIGLAVDFTGCTLIPLDKDGMPLCFRPELARNPLSWVNHWKHHGGTPYKAEVQAALEKFDPGLLKRHGGRNSDECMMAKVLHILREAPEVYEAMDMIMEGGDWLTMQITGKLVRSQAMAGFKAFWQERKGYPADEFYRQLDERLAGFPETKLKGELKVIGQPAGEVTEDMAKKLGLKAGTTVAAAHYDGHAAHPGSGISRAGDVMLTLGTSGGFILAYDKECPVAGTTGMTENGDIPGMYGYASGQFSVGDCFNWFVDNMLPESYVKEAKERNLPVQSLLTEKAAVLRPGESGLLALDWLGGNRSMLVDSELSCMMLGMTLQTKPEEIYRTLLESVAFGTRRIMEAHEAAGMVIGDIHAVGGIAKKNPLFMQIYADVLNRHIYLSKTTQAAALGSAVLAATAAGAAKGGYDTTPEAVQNMTEVEPSGYDPIPENVKIYNELYREFRILHDYFGTGSNDVMKRLKQLGQKQMEELN